MSEENDESSFSSSHEINPFSELGDLDNDDDSCEQKNDNHLVTAASNRTARKVRDWGLPTFQDQIDRGIQTLCLGPVDEKGEPLKGDYSSEGVILHLEHRLHSTGSDIWDSALVLAHALYRPNILPTTSAGSELALLLQGKHVVELGSGTGAVGLFCAKCLGAQRAVLTDLPANLALLHKNSVSNGYRTQQKEEPNGNAKVSIVSLDWTQVKLPEELNAEAFDIILGSDLFLPFAPEQLLRDLCRTLHQLLIQKRESLALICYEERFDCSAFFKEAERLQLIVEKVPDDSLHPKFQDPGRIHLLKVTASH